ncbi:hypothetical protein FRC01_010211, partial [Tulasnella sp. 417]
ENTGYGNNAAASSTYIAPLAGAQNITFQINGKTCTGQKAGENCAFLEHTKNGTQWWRYEDQQTLLMTSVSKIANYRLHPRRLVIVASDGSSEGVFGTSAGLAGMAYTAVVNGSDSIIGKYLTMEEDPEERWTFAIGSAGDSSGGYLHLNNPDPSFYTGSIQTMPLPGSDATVNWGAAPDQIGSYDWTMQSQGWILKMKNRRGDLTVTGGEGMWAMMEAGYPCILSPPADASKICLSDIRNGLQRNRRTNKTRLSSTLSLISYRLGFSEPAGQRGRLQCFFSNASRATLMSSRRRQRRPLCDVSGTGRGLASSGHINADNGCDGSVGAFLAMEEDLEEVPGCSVLIRDQPLQYIHRTGP